MGWLCENKNAFSDGGFLMFFVWFVCVSAFAFSCRSRSTIFLSFFFCAAHFLQRDSCVTVDERERESVVGSQGWGRVDPCGGARCVPSLRYTPFQGLCLIFCHHRDSMERVWIFTFWGAIATRSKGACLDCNDK
jgi:hypothetical protein